MFEYHSHPLLAIPIEKPMIGCLLKATMARPCVHMYACRRQHGQHGRATKSSSFGGARRQRAARPGGTDGGTDGRSRSAQSAIAGQFNTV